MPPPAPIRNNVDSKAIVRVNYALVRLVLFGVFATTTALAAPPKSAAPAQEPDVAAIYAEAAARFITTFRTEGMMGAAEIIDDCYKRASPKATSSCIAFDSITQYMALTAASLGLPPPLESLERASFDARMKKQLRLQGIDEKQMDPLIRRILAQARFALNLEYTRQERMKIKPFDQRQQGV